MNRVCLLTIFFIFLDLIILAGTHAEGVFGQQLQQQQQQNPGFGGDFTRITITQPSYSTPLTNYQPASNSKSKNRTDSWGTSSDTKQTDYTTQRPEDYGLLRDTGTSPGFSGPAPQTSQLASNGLWITDSSGKHYPSFSLPIEGYIEQELTPGMAGNLTIEELYPNGQVHTFSMGYVQPFHVYKMWFTADIPGTHKVRYNVDGYYSNIVEFYVSAAEGQGNSKAETEESTTVPTTADSATRIGGSYSSRSGYSSTTSQGGSVSISTSYG